MTDPTEAEALTDARRDLLSSLTGDTARPSTWESAVMDVFEEVVRATEREKVRALVERLIARIQSAPIICHACGNLEKRDYGTGYLYVDHTAGCPWVEARLWLARDEVPE